MIVGCYSLDLYCDASRHGELPYAQRREQHGANFTGETFSECARVARGIGWIVNRKAGRATCPYCAPAARRGKGRGK